MGGFHIGQPKLTDDDSVKLNSCRHRGGIIHGQLLDSPRAERSPHGQSAEGRLSQNSFSDDKLDAVPKRASKQITNRYSAWQTDQLDLIQHHEIIPLLTIRPHFCREGRARSCAGKPKRRARALYRVYRTQRSAYPSLHALSRGQKQHFILIRANAFERDGRAFRSLATGAAKLVEQQIGVLGMKQWATILSF